MQDKDLVQYTEALCSRANSEYSGISAQITNLIGKIRECKSRIETLNKNINDKYAQISGLNSSISQSQHNIYNYQQEIHDLMSSSSDDDEDTDSILRQVDFLRAKIDSENENIERLRDEIAALQDQIADLKSDIAELQELGRSYASDLKAQSEKCKKIGKALNTSGRAAAVVASRINNEAKSSFDLGAKTKFGSASASASAWSSNRAKKINDLANEAMGLGRKYHGLGNYAEDGADEDFTPGSRRGRSMER